MSDQNFVTNALPGSAESNAAWAAYFKALSEGHPYNPPGFQEMYVGFGECSITFVSGIDLKQLTELEGETLLDRAKEAWEQNGCPEMWLFANPSGPSWHVDAAKTVKKKHR